VRITVDIDLPAFEELLAGVLPSGIELKELQLDGAGLRMGLRAPMVGEVDLLAKLQIAPRHLTLHDFDLRGAGLAKGVALSTIRRKIAGLDTRRDDLHAWGETDGERVHLRWGPA
jgi:hypothetical protein